MKVLTGWQYTYRAGFDRKQNRYVAAIKNNSTTPIAGQVLIGPINTWNKSLLRYSNNENRCNN